MQRKVLHGLTLADPDSSIRKKARQVIKDMIIFGAELSAPCILGSMQGSYGADCTHETAIGYLEEAPQELGEFAISQGTFFHLRDLLIGTETNLFNLFEDACNFLPKLETVMA